MLFYFIPNLLISTQVIVAINMETVVTERLQKLRQWQAEQQQKLLKEQQIQREILSHKQDCIYKALGFPVQDLNNIVENTNELLIYSIANEDEIVSKSLDNALKNTKKGIVRDTITLYKDLYEERGNKDSNFISEVIDDNTDSTKNYSFSILQNNQLDADVLIEGIAPLSLNNITSNKLVSLDDIPVPSPKKDFQTLLEEKLNKESDVSCNNSQIKIKKPFLKKGQGLSRFKMSANSSTQSTTTKKRSASSSVNIRQIDRINKGIKATVQKDALSEHTWNEKQRLSLNTVPSLKGKVSDKLGPVISVKPVTANANGTKHSLETNASDFDSKTQRELEEVRIFELLEEKAENSSFCSTSSTVLAFLQQSTPFKVRERLNRSEGEVSVAVNAKQWHDKRASNTTERASTRRPFKQFYLRQRSHAHSTAAPINSYWDTITIDDSTEEEAPELRLRHDENIMIDEISRNDEDHLKDTPCNEPAAIVLSTDSDEERDILTEEPNALVHENEHADSLMANHRVRFSEHNEYRTIDLGNVSNTSSKSSLVCYLQRDDDNDHFVNTSPELSDVEEKLPSNYEEDMSAQQINSNERTVDASIQLSLQQGITENSYYRMMKALRVSKEENSAGCEDESPDNDNEKVVETYDEEQASVLSSSSTSSLSSLSDNHQKSTTRQKEEYILKSESAMKKTDKTNTFEPELLKSRLFELEKEIDIFRKESSALVLQRRKLQEDQTTLRKEYTEKERSFEEIKRRVQIQFEEEKRRLAREKAAMENRIRDAQEKAKQNKIERQKAQNLEEELEKLRDELNIKESRWSAAESRYKSELRALRTEISKLKQEIMSLQTAKKTSIKNARKGGGKIFAKVADQRINKPAVATSSREILVKSSQDLPIASPDGFVHEEYNKDKDKAKTEDKPTEPIMKTTDGNNEVARAGDTMKKRKSKREREIGSRSKCTEKFTERNAVEARKKRDLYNNLLNDATSDLVADQSSPRIVQDMSDLRQPIAMRDLSAKYDDFYPSSINENLERTTTRIANELERCNRSCQVNDEGNKENTTIGTQDQDLSTERTDSSLRQRASSAPSKMDIVRQIKHVDGHVEYWYPNGNVKKIFPDQGMTKMIYYNGDVRETERDGRVKYFYATTRTWHTTTPDGLEILEFPEYVALFALRKISWKFICGTKVLLPK